MKVSIDQEKCTGCQTCVTQCSSCFSMNGNVAECKCSGQGPECQCDCDVKEIASSCPTEAIIVE